MKMNSWRKLNVRIIIDKRMGVGQGGRRAVWNEKFRFRVELFPGSAGAVDQQQKLLLKIMDHDSFTSHDNLGQATYVSCMHACMPNKYNNTSLIHAFLNIYIY